MKDLIYANYLSGTTVYLEILLIKHGVNRISLRRPQRLWFLLVDPYQSDDSVNISNKLFKVKLNKTICNQ